MTDHIDIEYYYSLPVYGEECLKFFDGMECRINQLIYDLGDKVIIFIISIGLNPKINIDRKVYILNEK